MQRGEIELLELFVVQQALNRVLTPVMAVNGYFASSFTSPEYRAGW
jgi:hypothetical protein